MITPHSIFCVRVCERKREREKERKKERVSITSNFLTEFERKPGEKK